MQLLSVSIAAARLGKIIKAQSFNKVIVDTTVMEKAIVLRQNYNREAPKLARLVAR